MGQLNSYQFAFSRNQNKYVEGRDFQHFKDSIETFKKKGKSFVDTLA